jgi:hypothetical protein
MTSLGQPLIVSATAIGGMLRRNEQRARQMHRISEIMILQQKYLHVLFSIRVKLYLTKK